MRLQEVSLMTPDLEAARRFYCAILGLREVEPHWTGRLTVQVGESRLVLHPAASSTNPRYHFAFDVPHNRFDQAVAWVRERGGVIHNTDDQFRFHSDGWNADMVYFTDPQGNILELIARHDKPLSGDAQTGAADRPFNSTELIGISEIGIGVDSVVDTVAELQTRMPGIEVYDGQGSDMFTAVGDIHGLLIIARRGRIWYPNTGVPADHLPLEILLEVENGQRYRIITPPYPVTIRPEG